MQAYKVEKGDTLSNIAAKFGFDSHDPLFRYNTRVQQNISGGDPDKLQSGTTIIIPRTQSEYADVLENLENLKKVVVEDSADILKELGVAKQEAEAFGAKIDLAAELAMVGKGAVKASIKLGSKRLKSLALKKKMLEASQKVVAAGLPQDGADSLVIDKMTGAAVDNSTLVMAGRGLNTARMHEKFVKDTGKAYAKKVAVYTTRAITPVEQADGMAECVSMIADLVISGLEGVKPTNVAKIWLWATTGETPDDTNRKATEYVKQQTTRSLERLTGAIGRVRKEQQVVYPGGGNVQAGG